MAVSILFCGVNRQPDKFSKFGIFLRNIWNIHIKSRSCRLWWKFIRLSRGLTCWMWKKPIGKDDTKEWRVCVLYRDSLYRRFFGNFLGVAKLRGGCWRYRGPIGRDESREWWIWTRYRRWLYRRKIGAKKCVKTRGKWSILKEWGSQKSFLRFE